MRKAIAALACVVATGFPNADAMDFDRLGARLSKQTHCAPSLFVHTEATYLAPLADDSGNGLFTINDLEGAGTATVGTLNQYSDEFTTAPRITLGYRGLTDWGIQFRYWEIDVEGESSSNFPGNPVAPQNVSTVGGSNFFNAKTLDLELTRDLSTRQTSLLGTFGVRYAELEQGSQTNASGLVVDADTFDVFEQTSFSGSRAEGTGLTGSLSMLRSFRHHPTLALFASGRSSVLFGDAGAVASSTTLLTGTNGVATGVGAAAGGIDEAFFIGEVQAGLQWSKFVSSFNARMFARAAFEYQYWGADGGTALALSGASVPGESNGTALASADGFDNHLIGFALSTGFAW